MAGVARGSRVCIGGEKALFFFDITFLPPSKQGVSFMLQRLVSYLALVSLVLLVACQPITRPAEQPQILRLATTTSTADSGLLDAILPVFEQKYQARVEVVAVGTGQALEIGTKGDADVVLVHARAREDTFVAEGYGVDRRDVMYNDFVLVGPNTDPAAINGEATAKAALTKIAQGQAAFASRGDDSGTHTKEKSLWAAAEITPTAESGWYLAVGQGMGETLLFANEKGAYTLTDRATWLAMQDKLPALALLVGGASIDQNQDKALRNPYGVIPVNPAQHPGVNFTLASTFAEWLTSAETQQLIGAYGKEKFGQPLFYPSATQ
jgi:tungstate transport system substrate-binding protein